jgi:hypothetical protein
MISPPFAMFWTGKLSTSEARLLHIADWVEAEEIPEEIAPRTLGSWIVCYKRFCDARGYKWGGPRPIHAFLKYLSDRDDVDARLVDHALTAVLFYFRHVMPYPDSLLDQVRERWQGTTVSIQQGRLTRLDDALDSLARSSRRRRYAA